MTGSDQPPLRRPTTWWRIAYALTVAGFVCLLVPFRFPGTGLTSLIMFGENFAASRLPVLDGVDFFSADDSWGYDGQFYAQLAVQPDLRDPALRDAVDNLPYRARRILFSWTAHVLGLGRPDWVLHVFSLQNVVCWLALAVLLLRWFPPAGFSNYVRWAGVLFAVGTMCSVRGSLVDLPSLLLVAGAMALLESGRPWLAALGLGIAGLGKETSLLAGASLAPAEGRPSRDWAGALARGLLAAAPLLLWLVCLAKVTGAPGLDSGDRNFAPPFAGLWRKLATSALAAATPSPDPLKALGSLTMGATLAVQFLFFALRPRWRDAWWRIGATYAVLMAFLGDAVWEGDPGAAARAVLPLQLAFNIAVPRGRRWLALLLLGNLSAVGSFYVLRPPAYEEPILEGPRAVLRDRTGNRRMTAALDEHWLPVRYSHWDNWRWTTGPAALVVRNPHPHAVTATLTFRASAAAPRRLVVRAGDTVRWDGPLTGMRTGVSVPRIHLPPGETRLVFDTDRPPDPPGTPFEPYRIACRIFDLKLTVDSPPPAPPNTPVATP